MSLSRRSRSFEAVRVFRFDPLCAGGRNTKTHYATNTSFTCSAVPLFKEDNKIKGERDWLYGPRIVQRHSTALPTRSGTNRNMGVMSLVALMFQGSGRRHNAEHAERCRLAKPRCG